MTPQISLQPFSRILVHIKNDPTFENKEQGCVYWGEFKTASGEPAIYDPLGKLEKGTQVIRLHSVYDGTTCGILVRKGLYGDWEILELTNGPCGSEKKREEENDTTRL